MNRFPHFSLKGLAPFLMLGLLGGGEALAQNSQRVALAVWRLADGTESLVVSLADQMTEKQAKLVKGGFTTLSQLEIKVLTAENDDPDDAPVATSIRCSVKYDAWEETYDVAIITSEPRTALVKTFDDYAGRCLVGEIVDPKAISLLGPNGGTLWARLVVKQTSLEEASEIRDWLVEQQSGIMQRLFSHMLGELTLSQNLTVRVSVPPKPPAEIQRPSSRQPQRPKKG